ncbi:hypothetical protein [Pseudomonas sp. LH1G9]|uniref:hypothetical protein n=1 Tax=Pseudomonas sp. LH1G9 TaxID=2083055 RepID=UPI000CF31AEF|nr:hypothetical protein [Pseudomonas sp. LH1G9]
MYKMIAAISFLALTAATMTGCNDKDGSKGNAAAGKTTYYPSDKCTFDTIGGKTGASVYVPRGVVQFTGWAIDTVNQSSPKELKLRLIGYKGDPATFKEYTVVDRPDLVKAFNNQKLLKAGFSFKADLSALEPGGYSVSIEIPGESSSLLCQSKALLVIE